MRWILVLLLLGSAANAGADAGSTLTAPVIGATGAPIGEAMLRGGSAGVVLRLNLSAGALRPGWHGLHLHQIGDCSDLGDFKKAGSHVAAPGEQHGLLNAGAAEAGDLPNLWVAADGSAKAEFLASRVTLDGEALALGDADGSALVIHEQEDDLHSQPIGQSGKRVACAVIR